MLKHAAPLTLLLASCAQTVQPSSSAPRFKVLGMAEIVVGESSGIQAQSLSKSALQLKSLGNTIVDYNGYRYISTRYQVRNATSAGVASPTAKTNLTLLAGETANTLGNTAIRDIKKADGSAANSSLAPLILPTGTLAAGPVLASGQQSFQVFTSDELAPLAGTAGLLNAFPYGYVVDKVGGGRTLPANPTTSDYQGTVTVSVKVPLQTPLSDTPSSFTLAVLMVEDSVTQVSESYEEQALGNSGLAARVTAAGASRVNVFPSSTYSGTKRTLCSVPTSTAVSPTYLVNQKNRVTSFTPIITNLASKSTAVTTTLGYCDDVVPTLSGSTPHNDLVIQAFQTGKRLTFKNTTNAGTFSQTGQNWTYTPTAQAPFKPGEVVEVTVPGASNLTSSARRFIVGSTAEGAAGFNTSVAYTAAGSAQYIRFGDVDGDGDLDAVVATNGGYMSVFKNTGNGTFAPKADYTTSTFSQGIDLGDIDNDGDLDVITGNNNNCGPCVLSVNINDGTGAFTAGTSLDTATGTFASSTIGIAFGDFNNDGKLDVAAGSNKYVTVHQGNGNGTFTNRQDLYISDSAGATTVVVGDLNGDGYQDLVSSNATLNNISVFINKADGTVGFNSHVDYAAPSNVRGLTIGDLNKDGKLDVVSGSIQSNGFTVYLGNGDGTLAAGTTTSTSSPHNQMMLGDVNGDGNLDLVSTNPTIAPNGGLTYYLGNGNGTFQAGVFNSLGGNTRGIALGDLNGDGKLDMAGTTSTALNVFLKK